MLMQHRLKECAKFCGNYVLAHKLCMRVLMHVKHFVWMHACDFLYAQNNIYCPQTLMFI